MAFVSSSHSHTEQGAASLGLHEALSFHVHPGFVPAMAQRWRLTPGANASAGALLRCPWSWLGPRPTQLSRRPPFLPSHEGPWRRALSGLLRQSTGATVVFPPWSLFSHHSSARNPQSAGRALLPGGSGGASLASPTGARRCLEAAGCVPPAPASVITGRPLASVCLGKRTPVSWIQGLPSSRGMMSSLGPHSQARAHRGVGAPGAGHGCVALLGAAGESLSPSPP